MPTKAEVIADQNSCLNKAAPHEPIFVLRAKDPIAVKCIRYWATLATGIHEPEKTKQALDCAAEFQEFGQKQS